ncbi:hypothetical protein ACFSJW_08605 [Flavobacterium artemisiae]|uniref:Uncharacterized protein n=1 Tax=Flavobacterium artemisiae TaxID=2126556 RepID=A0ABW4HFH7_9FLAO
MKLTDNIKITSTKISNFKNYSIIKDAFTILDLEVYLENKKYFFLKDHVHSDDLLIIVSSENLGYKNYIGATKYQSSFDKIFRILEKHTFLQKEKTSYLEYYIIISKEDFINNEHTLYELFILFNFSLIIGLKEKFTEKDLLRKLNKFSFLDVFNSKRWSKIADWQLFFDTDHLSGNIKYEKNMKIRS